MSRYPGSPHVLSCLSDPDGPANQVRGSGAPSGRATESGQFSVHRVAERPNPSERPIVPGWPGHCPVRPAPRDNGPRSTGIVGRAAPGPRTWLAGPSGSDGQDNTCGEPGSLRACLLGTGGRAALGIRVGAVALESLALRRCPAGWAASSRISRATLLPQRHGFKARGCSRKVSGNSRGSEPREFCLAARPAARP